MAKRGIKIREVEAGSAAGAAGLAAGDEILAVNGHPVPDELALKFHLAEGPAELEVRKAGGFEEWIEVELAEGQNLGIEVEDFRTRTCNNACLFCFINQLPPGARQSLKIKDDDFRLSFLHGNYITLTNLSDRDLDRIIEQALSPLYVSVHATEPDLRARIMGRKKPDDFAGKLLRLINGGIRIQTQVVLIPEINDGEHLAKTVFDLYSWHPGVHSVAIVPLGLSDHGADRRQLTPVTSDYCRKVVAQVLPWQRRFRRETGRGFAYLADEFYIQGGIRMPDSAHYDDFAQIEDGIGMVRRFLDAFGASLARPRKPRPGLRGTLATGTLFCPFLSDCTRRINGKLGSDLRVMPVANRFMGRSITVAGLLAGRDFAHALAGVELGDFVMIPQEAVSRVEGIFVDDWTPADLALILDTPVILSGPSMSEFFKRLCNPKKRGHSEFPRNVARDNKMAGN